MSSSNVSENEYNAGVRLIALNLPEDAGEGLGFRLTRTQWDPYPWVREVSEGSRADLAGLRPGDCVLQADGRDLLGITVGQVAGLIRGDGAGHGVSLLVWSCGVDPRDDPELLWSCGGGARGERARRALAGAVRALACCVCAATASHPRSCARDHLYCHACWARLERCAICRETLPPKDSPYARNLVAEQVFEAIAIEYEIKDAIKQKPTQTSSVRNSPNRSPIISRNNSPSANRKGRYQLSMMNKKRTVQFHEKFGQNYSSDPNIHRSSETQEFKITRPLPRQFSSAKVGENSHSGNTDGDSKSECCCASSAKTEKTQIPKIFIEDTSTNKEGISGLQNVLFQHKLVTRLRPACSLADLQNIVFQSCKHSQSLNNINLAEIGKGNNATGSLDDLKNNKCMPACDSPLLVVSPQPIYVLACEHSHQ